MSKGKVVLLDIDSTLNNFQEHFLKLFLEKYPDFKEKLPDDPVHFDVLKMDKAKGLEILEADGFTEGMVPLPGAVEAVNELDRRGYCVFFCTALVTDYSNAMRDRVHWIGKWFGEKWMSKIIFTLDKTMVRGDFLIDDSPFKTKGCQDPLWKLIVFDLKYNRDKEYYGRIYGWTDLDKLFDLLEKE